MNEVLGYIENNLGLSVTITDVPENALKKLPMFLSYAYNYKLIEIENVSFLLVEEKERNTTVIRTAGQLNKFVKIFREQVGLSPIFVLYNLSPQMRRNLIANRISFVVPDSQLYLPEMLIVLKESNLQPNSFPELLTPSAQLLLLYHLQVERLESFSFKGVAEKLGYSPKTITKIAEELKVKNISQITGTKEKCFVFEEDSKQLWQLSEPQMQSPIIKSYFTSFKGIEQFCKSGDVALAHYTFLNETGKESIAVPKTEFDKLKASDYWEYLDEIEGDIQLEIWKYNPAVLSDNGYIDPLSLYLCYREDKDARVEGEMEKLIEQRKW
ncbi:MAG: hypothetical protein QM654_09340 [Dysgonamonadaceae bacterium]